MTSALFYFFGIILIIAGVYAVTTKHIIRAVFSLFVVFFCISAVLVFAQADFLAISHLVIYVGGILVLMVFAIMLSDKKVLDINISKALSPKGFKLSHIANALLCVLIFYVLGTTIFSGYFDSYKMQTLTSSVEKTGVELMTAYLFPFELISFLLLFALVAAAYIARKDSKNV